MAFIARKLMLTSTLDDQWEQAHITFNVRTGKRAHYESPHLLETLNPARGVIRATRWIRLYGFLNLGWQQVTEARTRQGIENVRRYYEKNLLESHVTLTKLDYHETLEYGLSPRFKSSRATHSRYGLWVLALVAASCLQVIPIFQEKSIDTDLLVEGDRSLVQYLQNLGYFEAEVTHSVASRQEQKEQVVSYQVVRGSRHKFVDLEMYGKSLFP